MSVDPKRKIKSDFGHQLRPEDTAMLEDALLEALPGPGELDDHLEEKSPEVPEILDLLPLRDSVIYPMLIAPLSVTRPSSIKLIEDAVESGIRIIGAVTQRKSQHDNPEFTEIYPVGCAVIIRTLVKMNDATRLIVQGISRFRIVEELQSAPYLRARIELLPEPEIPDGMEDEIEAIKRSITDLFDQAVLLSPHLPEELRSLTDSVQEPHVLADLVAAHMTLPVSEKQEILETLPMTERMKMLLGFMSREVRVLELSSKVQSEVSVELSKTQREYYLREQLKAIQRELGESDDKTEELEEIRIKMEAVGLPAAAKSEVKREYDRLRRINPGSPEYTVARTYVDTMLSMPWAKSTHDRLDLGIARKILDDEHFGLEKIKDRIVEFLAVRKMKEGSRIRQPILCLVGPPGVGKTSLGRSIASAMERKFVRISLGGMRDEAEIRGHRRTYIGALPGQIMQGLRRVESNNPVFVLDEIDKLGSDFRGDPSSALLEVLDPEQNVSFRDHYLDTQFDLGNVFWIATANRLDTIPAALRDRMEIIEVGGYTEDEKFEIAKRHLLPKQIEEHGLATSKIEFKDEAIRHIARFYTREAGVRNLERELAAVLRKCTVQFADGRKAKLKVTDKVVEEFLGSPRFLHDEINDRVSRPGTAVGLAWTPVGGDILFIETAMMPGKGLTITGQLGDVMKESVSASMTFIRSNAKLLGLEEFPFGEQEIHVHVPAGAVPKDGPSAGVTMLSALVSLLKNEVLVPRIAMTGEITVTGQVLPVGGIKEKIVAAQRAGVKSLILPEENRKDYMEEVPAHIQSELEVTFVTRAEEVLAKVLGSMSELAIKPKKKKSSKK